MSHLNMESVASRISVLEELSIQKVSTHVYMYPSFWGSLPWGFVHALTPPIKSSYVILSLPHV